MNTPPSNNGVDRRRVLILCGSPRRNGNSRRMADAAAEGAAAARCHVRLEHVDDHVSAFLRDCRTCRNAEGRCTIGDGFETLLRDAILPADGIVFATPLYWYGVAGQLKTCLDRLFCYIAASHPDADAIAPRLMHKRLGVLISSEETYPAATHGIVHQFQEYARYTRGQLIDVVRGIGNKRGDVSVDPADPLARCRRLGANLLTAHHSDYCLDSDRAGSVWDDIPPRYA
ncbi:MAG: flavodoxin family protein [Phycisphaeraceae bacterium]